MFIESGWTKSSLRPAHAKKGNRTLKVDPIIVKVLDELVREYRLASVRVNYTKAHEDFVARIEKINGQRSKDG